MTTREQLLFERVEALFDMIETDGATHAGDLPPVEHICACRETEELGQAREVADAHRDGLPPGGQS
jgi:hypothetical protein